MRKNEKMLNPWQKINDIREEKKRRRAEGQMERFRIKREQFSRF